MKEKVDFLHTGIKYVCTVGKGVKKIQTKTVTKRVVENKKHHTCVIEEA